MCGRREPGEEGGRGDTGQGRRDGGTWKRSDLPHSHLFRLVLSSPGRGPGSEDHREPSGMAGVEKPASSPPPPHTHTSVITQPKPTGVANKPFTFYPATRSPGQRSLPAPSSYTCSWKSPPSPKEPAVSQQARVGTGRKPALAQEGSRPPMGHFLSTVGVV